MLAHLPFGIEAGLADLVAAPSFDGARGWAGIVAVTAMDEVLIPAIVAVEVVVRASLHVIRDEGVVALVAGACFLLLAVDADADAVAAVIEVDEVGLAVLALHPVDHVAEFALSKRRSLRRGILCRATSPSGRLMISKPAHMLAVLALALMYRGALHTGHFPNSPS
ncbi:MAG: hypothetical protein MZV49_24135 [Rhodopseudomonas palustris]|nr:hypothetical protein [Rhodopseudomonas palustris]